MPILHRCAGVPGQPCRVLCEGVRCPVHQAAYETARTRRKRQVRPYTAAERRRRALAVQAWVAENGPVCPGWRRPAHAVPREELTADHPDPVAAGGDEEQPLEVLCRSCNGAKADSVELDELRDCELDNDEHV